MVDHVTTNYKDSLVYSMNHTMKTFDGPHVLDEPMTQGMHALMKFTAVMLLRELAIKVAKGYT